MLRTANILFSPTDTVLDRPAASSGEKAGENVVMKVHISVA